MKAVLREKFISQSTINKRRKDKQINDITLLLRVLEKEEQSNTQSNRRQEVVKIRAEINEGETKETIEKIDKINTWFFEKINKIDKPLATLTKRRREKIQITKIRNEQENITTDTSEIQTIIRSNFENLHSKRIENLKDINRFLETYELPKLNQEDIHNLNTSQQVMK